MKRKAKTLLFLLTLSLFLCKLPVLHGKQSDNDGPQSNTITFTDEDLRGIEVPHNDRLVVSMTVANSTRLDKILVANGASANVLFFHALKRLGFTERDVEKVEIPRDYVDPKSFLGIIALPVTIGDEPRSSTVMVDFWVHAGYSFAAYDAIFGIPGLSALRGVSSTYHLLLRFPTEAGIGQVRGDQLLARKLVKKLLQMQVKAGDVDTHLNWLVALIPLLIMVFARGNVHPLL
ncbi:unnamed protein product [Prunus armeniaca]|uniref:Uncharacterized protein n=1 Tax=Prunus armeniaca TaxID=36596 RepID=A0A6J5W3J7_PRUAR|nr:hypothetical protein GBA52_003508 [Prunus armeniaca]CAB4263931.1 unnamed protein product [Prunus armeniaca]CAB4294542.1 unnamed protein product [Prunus armeniaca]